MNKDLKWVTDGVGEILDLPYLPDGASNATVVNNIGILVDDVETLQHDSYFVKSYKTFQDGSNDFLAINMNGWNNLGNETIIFNKPQDDGDYQNFPSDLSGKTWIGVRRVYYRGSTIATIEIIEMLPTPGRTWYNTYSNSSWTGWKSHT
jgi:hypothetical protein